MPAASARDTDEVVDETITVEAKAPEGPDPSRVPAALTVIEVDERVPASADVAQVVDSAAGITVRRLGGLGEWATVSIRGSRARQVLVCLDGVPLNPDGATAVNLGELPLRAFSRVEVYRGNAPPELGSAAMGGAIDLVTGDGRPSPLSLAVAAGSLRTGRLHGTVQLRGDLGGVPTDLLLVGEGTTTRADFRYFSDNGTPYELTDDHLERRDNNGKQGLTTHARWRLGVERLRLTLLDAFLARHEGLPGHANTPARQSSLDVTRNVAVAQIDTHGDAATGRVRLWSHLRSERLDDRAAELGAVSAWGADRTHSAGVQVHGEWLPLSVLALGLTADGRADAYHREDLELGLRSARSTRLVGNGSVHASWWAWGERVLVAPVVQGMVLDNRYLGELDPTEEPLLDGARSVEMALTPRLGVLVRPVSSVAIKANAGRYLRPPDLTELFGDRGFAKGNAGLVPERGVQLDAGARWVLPVDALLTGSVEATAFRNDATDLVVWLQNAQGVMVAQNVGRARVVGVESAVHLELAGWVESRTSLGRTWSTNLGEAPSVRGNRLPGVPELELEQRTAVHWGESVRVGHTFSYADGEFWDTTNFHRAAPRAFHGAFASVQPGGRWPTVELDVLNLTDRIAEVVPRNPLDPSDRARMVQAVTDFVGYPLPGRTWMVTVRWSAEAGDSSHQEARP